MDSEKEIRQFLEGLMGLMKQSNCCSENRCEEDEDEDEDECPEIQSLQKDYTACMTWAFGGESAKYSSKRAKKLWKNLHPDIPVPRILKSEVELNPHMSTICLIMDIYPYYLKSKQCNG